MKARGQGDTGHSSGGQAELRGEKGFLSREDSRCKGPEAGDKGTRTSLDSSLSCQEDAFQGAIRETRGSQAKGDGSPIPHQPAFAADGVPHPTTHGGPRRRVGRAHWSQD